MDVNEVGLDNGALVFLHSDGGDLGLVVLWDLVGLDPGGPLELRGAIAGGLAASAADLSDATAVLFEA